MIIGKYKINDLLVIAVVVSIAAVFRRLDLAILPVMLPVFSAHCDTMTGPVVLAGEKALDTEKVDPALIWVKEKYEPKIRRIFKKTLRVRKLNLEAKELADMHFFETLVRLHQAGEGEPYMGIKPDISEEEKPVIAAVDRALIKGSADNLVKDVSDHVAAGIKERFDSAIKTLRHRDDSVGDGRKWVEAYVEYVHYAKRLYSDAVGRETKHHE